MDPFVFNKQLAAKEKHLISFPRSGDIRVVLAYPNRYWVAMSNLGFQTVYRLLSSQTRFSVERAYLPESDGVTIKTFETNSPLSSADILALSVSFETDYPNVVSILSDAGIKLDSRRELNPVTASNETTYFRPFILGGGAALTLNPEPLANLFDAIVIGEAEEVLAEFSSVYVQAREDKLSFKELLFQLSKIEGIYVPSLFKISYSPNGKIEKFIPAPGIFSQAKRRYLKDLDAYPTTTVIQTPETEFRSMYMTETGRGCEVGCRFCVAGYMYRPTRKRNTETIAQAIKVGIENSESIGFVGAAVSSHPQIAKLARSVAENGKRAALSSIMSQRVTTELAASLSESEYKTVALAPEAGSENLRFRIGKRVCDEQIINAVKTLAENGIRNFKLYFIVGLPSETLEDVKQIVELVRLLSVQALEAARTQVDFRIAPKIILSVNPFIPKAWTPFQRHPFLGHSQLKKRLSIVRNGIARLSGVEMKAESPKESYFQALMSRGDRRVGDLLIDMFQQGRDWKSLVVTGGESTRDGIPPADFYVMREFEKNEILPWEIVDLRIKRSLLEREYERTFLEDVLPLVIRAREEFSLKGKVEV